MFINSFGLMLIYFIVFSGIAASLASLSSETKDQFYCKRWIYVLVVGVLCLPFVLQHQIKHLKIASFLLFLAIFLFVISFIIELAISGTEHNPDESFDQYY